MFSSSLNHGLKEEREKDRREREKEERENTKKAERGENFAEKNMKPKTNRNYNK